MGELSYALFAFAVALVWPLTIGATRRSTRFEAVFLGAPFFAAVRARKRRGVAATTGAYVAYLAGAAVDWDWEITSVTLAAVFVGVALLAAARSEDEREASPDSELGSSVMAGATP
jgi:ABC-type Co2+ transport system permease subunit